MAVLTFNPLEYIKEKVGLFKLYVEKYGQEKITSIKPDGVGSYNIEFKDGKNVVWKIHDMVTRDIKLTIEETSTKGISQGFILESYSPENLAFVYEDIFHTYLETEVLDEEGEKDGNLYKIHFIFSNELIG